MIFKDGTKNGLEGMILFGGKYAKEYSFSLTQISKHFSPKTIILKNCSPVYFFSDEHSTFRR